MFKRAFAAIWRGVKAVFTLKGLLTSLLVGALVAGVLLFMPREVNEPRRVEMTGDSTGSTEPTATPRIAIVIVGLGAQGKGLDALIGRLMSLNVPLTYGIFPATDASRRQARLVDVAPSEVALQLPIAFSQGPTSKRPGVVTSRMRRRQIARQVVTDIYSLGRVAGIVAPGGYANGRTDGQMMRIVLTMAKRRNLYFLDLEDNGSASRIADGLGVQYLKPDVVLDDVQTADGVKSQISVAINKAVSTQGNIIVVGQLLPVTVNTLMDSIDKIRKADIELTSISGLSASTEPTAGPSLPTTPTLEPSPTILPTSTVPPTTTAPAPGSQFNF